MLANVKKLGYDDKKKKAEVGVGQIVRVTTVFQLSMKQFTRHSLL